MTEWSSEPHGGQRETRLQRQLAPQLVDMMLFLLTLLPSQPRAYSCVKQDIFNETLLLCIFCKYSALLLVQMQCAFPHVKGDIQWQTTTNYWPGRLLRPAFGQLSVLAFYFFTDYWYSCSNSLLFWCVFPYGFIFTFHSLIKCAVYSIICQGICDMTLSQSILILGTNDTVSLWHHFLFVAATVTVYFLILVELGLEY